MSLLDELYKCESTIDLENFISDNYLLLIDYLQFSEQSELKDDTKLFKCLSLKISEFESLDYTKNHNIAFLNAILNASIRLCDRFTFREFFRLLKNKHLALSKLVEASSLFMLDGHNFTAFDDRFDELHEKLEQAFSEEEDGHRNVISVLVNYYQFLISNFNEFAHECVENVRQRLWENLKSGLHQFNQVDVLDEVLSVNIDNGEISLKKIDKIIDSYLNRRSFIISSRYTYLVESGTDYFQQLGQAPYNTDRVLATSKKMYPFVASDNIYNSLQRGVNVITTSEALLCYNFAFGNMHKAKLVEAISKLNFQVEPFRVIDWGCGQGLGSLYLLEYLNTIGVNTNAFCKKTILIEPSEIAISRAALHLQGYANDILTYCKDIDSMVADDLVDLKMSTIHIFSNILDIDYFSLTNLVELIKGSSKGKNYFVIVSPQINELKTERIDSFVNAFKSLPNFKMNMSTQAARGEWINSWTKLIRVFETTL